MKKTITAIILLIGILLILIYNEETYATRSQGINFDGCSINSGAGVSTVDVILWKSNGESILWKTEGEQILWK